MKGWTTATLADVCNLITDGTHHSPANALTGAFKYVTAKNIRPWGLDLDVMTYVDQETHRGIYARCPVEFGDVLYIKDGVTTGIAALNTLHEPFSMLSSVALLKPNRELLLSGYLKHWLNSPIAFQSMTAGMTGTAIKRLVLKQIRGSELLLAPLAEQKRIADKLDTVLARVDACRESLDNVPSLIRRFRASVLEAAASGRLTEAWRAARPAPDHLIRGVVAKSQPDMCLPLGWVWSSPEEVKADERHSLAIGPFGSDLTVKDYRDEGIPLVFVREIRARKFGDQKTKYVSAEKAKELAAHKVSAGDLLITKMGDPPGDTAIYPDGTSEAIVTADCIKLRVNPLLALSKFVGYVVASPQFKERLREITAGVAQQKISLKRLRHFPLQLAPLEEQREIVRRVEALFEYADSLDVRLSGAKQTVERLTPSLLAKAFRGELVPQDPNDEPAAKLLKRLAEERSGAGVAAKNSRERKSSRVVEDEQESSVAE